ncbi:hypothetical protein VCR3J2_80200 [Vibrio coralliirubri]|nr:hypothetical protein VCR3J2_80200 [Vibrio coralliirubri]
MQGLRRELAITITRDKEGYARYIKII